MTKKAGSFAAASVCLISFFACQKQQPPETATTVISVAESKAEIQPAQEPAGKPAKKSTEYKKTLAYFRAPSYSGADIDLAYFAGRPVLLFFVSPNCRYCYQLGPEIEKIYQKYKGKGLAVIALTAEDGIGGIERFIKTTGISFPVAVSAEDIFINYGARGVPYSFLLDKEHNPLFVWPGYDEDEPANISQAVEKVLR